MSIVDKCIVSLNKYDKALTDFNKAISSENLTGKDLLSAIEGRISAYNHLGKTAESSKEFAKFNKICQSLPKIIYFNDRTLIRNVPDLPNGEFFQTSITSAALQFGMIESEDSIQKYPSKIWIIKKNSSHTEESLPWVDSWCRGIELVAAKDFTNSLTQFSTALNQSQHVGDNYPEIFVDRGQVYLSLEKYDEALADFDKAMNSEKLSSHDLLLAIEGRMTAFAQLGKDAEWEQEMAKYKKISQTYPKMEFFKDKIIIRNVPEDDFFQKLITLCFIKSRLIENESAIKKYSSEIWIIKINPLNKSDEITSSDEINSKHEVTRGCQSWCDKVAESCKVWCQVFKTIRCQSACIFVVEYLKDGCYWCCGNGNFYDECVKPFEDLLKVMAEKGYTCHPDID